MVALMILHVHKEMTDSLNLVDRAHVYSLSSFELSDHS